MNARWRPYSHPWVIAHRGASGLLPEHTLPGYALAIEQGADVIEPDLVASADGVLYARHDLFLSRSTDVASRAEFAAFRRSGPDGVLDWWIDDFTSAQLDTLRAIQPWPQRPHHRDGSFRIPRFSEVLALLRMERARRERPLLVYPELKHPEYFRARGIDVVDLFLRELATADMLGADAPVVVQCFERATLDQIGARAALRRVQLSVDLPALHGSPVEGYGVSKQALLSDAGPSFIEAAHAAGRLVHAWTFRDDQPVAGLAPTDECARAYRAGCDGLFSDFPATALSARNALYGAASTPLRVIGVVGQAIEPYLPALAALRIRVFRDWPYLYDGDLAYEARYLQTYSRSPRSLFVLAFDGERIVGCSTAIPLRDETPEIQQPFVAAGFDLNQICYFGESVLEHGYRGRGLGHRFFDAREAHARLDPCVRYTAFCAVQRSSQDPRRPLLHRELDAFWQGRGYAIRPDLRTRIEWKELGDDRTKANDMVFWLREWVR